jgi:hypothetical protein
MIQLKAISRPSELTDEKVIELTQRYIETGESVWIQRFIKDFFQIQSWWDVEFQELEKAILLNALQMG